MIASLARCADSGGHRRIVVVGTSGSGKTTLAAELARRLGLVHVELDALFWDPDWTQAPRDAFRQRVSDALAQSGWVADGNYGPARDITWTRADTVVWLDYPLWVNLVRLLRRTVPRVVLRQQLYGGNRERFKDQFLSRESLFLHALRTHGEKRRQYPTLFASPEYRHLRVVHLRSPRATREWLASLARPALATV